MMEGCDPDSSTDSGSDVETNGTEERDKKDKKKDEKLNERPYIHQRRVQEETDTESSTGYDSDSSTEISSADEEESRSWNAKKIKILGRE